jgi:hypothetical protein
MDDKERELWLRRAEIVGRAQERYLWLLLVVGVFFFAVDRSPVSAADLVSLPILAISIRPGVVWAIGPIVLGFVIIAAMGSLRAYRTVEDTLKGAGVDLNEAFDTAPNALDFAFYTTPKSPLVVRQVFLFVYPAYFALFLVESVYLLVMQLVPRGEAPEYPFLWVLGVTMVLWSGALVASYWHRNYKRARAIK